MKKKEKIIIATALFAGLVAFVVARRKKEPEIVKQIKHLKKSRHASPILESLKKEQNLA